MHYIADSDLAFASVEHIMRDVNSGWLIRYMHSTGASFFFIIIYLHMLRALMYGSYKKPRELLWLFGMFIFVLLMAIFQSNAGGAWDNAKKTIEEEGRKGSDAHKAAVVGDTVGDPFKDTSGPSLNILIKLMSVVALVIASSIV